MSLGSPRPMYFRSIVKVEAEYQVQIVMIRSRDPLEVPEIWLYFFIEHSDDDLEGMPGGGRPNPGVLDAVRGP